jgi:hypothetical protein
MLPAISFIIRDFSIIHDEGTSTIYSAATAVGSAVAIDDIVGDFPAVHGECSVCCYIYTAAIGRAVKGFNFIIGDFSAVLVWSLPFLFIVFENNTFYTIFIFYLVYYNIFL